MLKEHFVKKKIALALFGLCLALIQTSFAATFTVKKVKGKQALIEYTGPQLENGRTYTMNTSSDNSPVSRSNFAILREISVSSLSSTIAGISAGTNTRFSLILGYGWNYESFEFAPLIGFSTVSASGGNSATTFNIGGLFDYNFQNNIIGNDSILGLGTEVGYAKASGSSTTDSPATMSAFAGGFWKWFIFGPTACLRLDLGYQYTKISSTSDAVQSGFLANGGFAVYF